MKRTHTTPTTKTIAVARLRKIGDQGPYFRLVMERYEKSSSRGHWYASALGGAHDYLLDIWPDLQPLADLHMSDINGVPLHVVDNAYYWYGGTGWQPRDNGLLALLLRISESEAAALSFPNKQALAAYIDTLRPRWKREAERAIETFGLTIEERRI